MRSSLEALARSNPLQRSQLIPAQLQAAVNTASGRTSLEFPASDTTLREGPTEASTPELDEASQNLVGRMLRANLAAEAASIRLFAGQSAVRPHAADVKLFKERGEALLERVQAIAPQHRTRPSLLTPIARAAAFGVGAASAVLPNKLRATVAGAMQEAIVEQYNDQLRELREAGLAEQLTEVRVTLRELRDEERAPDGTVQAPDLMKLQRPQDLSLEEGVAGVVKYGFKALFSAAERV